MSIEIVKCWKCLHKSRPRLYGGKIVCFISTQSFIRITSVLFFVVCIYYAHFSQSLKFLFLALTAITHFIVYPLYASYINAEDPADYTLDEIVGVLFISYFLPNETYIWILAIVLFRFFDILKPFGIRKFETSRLFSSSMRVIGDDIIAAFYTLILIEAVLYGIK